MQKKQIKKGQKEANSKKQSTWNMTLKSAETPHAENTIIAGTALVLLFTAIRLYRFQKQY